MAVIKCKMCGGDLLLTEGSSVAECEYCGSRQTVPAADNEKKLTLFGRANRLRAACEFDKAAGIYETIVADFPEESEAYWGLVLCKYGIEYVDDPGTGKKIPTCHRSSFESVMDDTNYEQAMENADVVARKVYREEANQIEQIRKGIIEVSEKEPPYDVFICYKETDENGDRTIDSVLAQNIYDMLCQKNYRVFFARITLEDKLGCAYEPFIFAALNSAKIMLAVGTDYDYYDAVWVKNEWSRFLKLMEKDKSKHLIPCYKGISPYDMPKEFAHLQAQDLGKVGADQDLMRGIEKLLPKTGNAAAATAAPNTDNKVSSQLERGMLALEDGEWRKANDFFENVLNSDPRNAKAYLGKLMIEHKVSNESDLALLMTPLNISKNYDKILRFGDADLQHRVVTYNMEVTQRIENYNSKKQNLQDKKDRVLWEINQSEQVCLQARHRCENLSKQIGSKNYHVLELSNVLDEKRQALANAKKNTPTGRGRIAFYLIATLLVAALFFYEMIYMYNGGDFRGGDAAGITIGVLMIPNILLWLVKDMEQGRGFWSIFFRLILWTPIRAVFSFIGCFLLLALVASLFGHNNNPTMLMYVIIMGLPLLYPLKQILKIRKTIRGHKKIVRAASKAVTVAEEEYRKKSSNDPELAQLNKALEQARIVLAKTEEECKARIREVNQEYIADAKRDGFVHEDLVPQEFK